MKNRAIEKILWAVDLFGTEESELAALRALRPLVQATGASVEPVFVLTPRQSGVSPLYFPRWEEPFQALAEKKMAELKRRCDLPAAGNATVLVEVESSMRAATAKLIDHARKSGADLIAASTHARRGAPRLFLGSFAETLVLQSTIPVLTINPRAQTPAKIGRVLFPSDFSQPSRRGFEATVGIARGLGAEITLYYKTPLPLSVVFPEAPNLYEYLEEEDRNRKKSAEAWADWAMKNGVKTRLELDERPGDVAKAILDYAHESKCDLISLVAQSGPISSVLLGSVARQVVRQAECPVWVQHAK